MPRENMTLEQLQEREEKLLAQKKERATKNIAKIEARITATKDSAEIARLSDLLKRHKDHQQSLDFVDTVERSSLQFSKFKGRFELKEEVRSKEVDVSKEKFIKPRKK